MQCQATSRFRSYLLGRVTPSRGVVADRKQVRATRWFASDIGTFGPTAPAASQLKYATMTGYTSTDCRVGNHDACRIRRLVPNCACKCHRNAAEEAGGGLPPSSALRAGGSSQVALMRLRLYAATRGGPIQCRQPVETARRGSRRR